MGVLNAKENEHLYFLQRITKRKKLKGARDTLKQGEQAAIDVEFYQQSWAFVYFCKSGDCAKGFKDWETKLLAGELAGPERQLEAFQKLAAPDVDVFDKKYGVETAESAASFGR
jgi:hypothetical protein